MVKILVPRLAHAMEIRHQRLEDDLSKAKALNEDAYSLREENLLHLSKAHEEASKMISHTLEELAHFKQQRLQAFDADLATKTKEMRLKFTHDQHEILSNVSGLITQILVDITPKLFFQTIPEKKLHHTVEHVIKTQRT
jgi:F0F1-type ATP synthase membrane subunit b/b'